jgi:hypothetical protein
MHQFRSQRAYDVYRMGFASGVPQNVAKSGQRLMQKLVTVRSIQDVVFIKRLTRSIKNDGRIVIAVEDKWVISFVLEEGFGAKEIDIERWKTRKL